MLNPLESRTRNDMLVRDLMCAGACRDESKDETVELPGVLRPTSTDGLNTPKPTRKRILRRESFVYTKHGNIVLVLYDLSP